MDLKRSIEKSLLIFSVIFASYLIFSLNFVGAYEIGEANRRIRFVIEPSLKIAEDIQPFTCDSSGYITFKAYVENVPEQFEIKNIEAKIYDNSLDRYYDISTAVVCAPKTKLISNQEITCKISIRELLSLIPNCPLTFYSNPFYLSFDISYLDKNVRVSDSKEITITKEGTKPSLEINFNAATPPYPIPEINCKTGSEIDVPVVIHHAETFFGPIEWSFSVNNTRSSFIECEKIVSNAQGNEGRDDIYLCSLTIPNTIFTNCEEGSEITIEIVAKTKKDEIKADFSTVLVSKELELHLSIGELGKIECQIVDKEGACYPKDPQRNVTVTITGNVPEKLKVFEARYKIDNEKETLTFCKKRTSTTYSCMLFVTYDKLPLPQRKDDKTTKTRQLSIFFDVKYMNYYKNISATTQFVMEGKALDELLNTLNVLEKEGLFLKKLKKFVDFMQKYVIPFVNFLSKCCLVPNLIYQMSQKVLGEEGAKKSLSEILEAYLHRKIIIIYDSIANLLPPLSFKLYAQKVYEEVVQKLIKNVFLDLLKTSGIRSLLCIIESGEKIIKNEQNNLEKFERGEITSLEIPKYSFFEYVWKLIEANAPDCLKQQTWGFIKHWSNLLGYLCGFVIFIVMYYHPSFVGKVCDVIMKATGPLDIALNLSSMLLGLLMQLNAYNRIHKSLALARERINLQTKATQIISDYTNYFENTMEALILNTATSKIITEIFEPPKDMVKLIFISNRKGVLKSGDEVCYGDKITIEYDFEKLAETKDFIPQLSISNSNTKTLRFSEIKGVYGPYEIELILGVDTSSPSEIYTFTLKYEDKSVSYQLKYVNHPCM
jgi:hypothetical protein